MRLLTFAAATVLAALTFASPAFASSVGKLTVDNTKPTAAAGARTIYVVDFTTSPTGMLSYALNDRISITFPETTQFGGGVSGTVQVGTTDVGGCFSPSGLTIACFLDRDQKIDGGQQVRVTLEGVTNPAVSKPGSPDTKTITVSTTADKDPAQARYTVLPAGQVGKVTVSNFPNSRAAGARTTYVIGFALSDTGALDYAANSRIILGFPDKTSFPGGYSSTVVDVTAGKEVGACFSPSGLEIQCFLDRDTTVAAGHQLQITLGGVTNTTTTGPATVNVSTTSDPQPVPSSPFDIVPAGKVGKVTVSNSPPTQAAGGRTVYTLQFTTSDTGALDYAANSRIILGFPDKTSFPGGYSSTVVDVTAGKEVGACFSPSGLEIQCFLDRDTTVAAGHQLQITLGGVTNTTTTGPATVNVSTTSDPQPVPSSPFDIVPAGAPSATTAELADHAASAATVYTITFKTSATGGLSYAANSRMSVTFPAGTTFVSGTTRVDDAATGGRIGACFSPSSLRIECFLDRDVNVAPGAAVRITLGNVKNPAAEGDYALTVSTTSDVAAGPPAGYHVGAGSAAPDTTIDDGPSGDVADSTPTFRFSSTTSGATFECRLEDGEFTSCESPYTTPELEQDGTYVFEVRATSPEGVVDPSPASRTFTLDTLPPDPPAISAPDPDASLSTSTVALRGTTDETAAVVEIREGDKLLARVPVGDGRWSANLSATDGTHTYSAFAEDEAGNRSDPTSLTVHVDTRGPETTIESGPSGETTDTTASFAFASSAPDTTFECRLDGPAGSGAYAPCSSPSRFDALTPGGYTFFVRATDAAGRDTTRSQSFTVIPAQQPSPPQQPPPPAPTPTPTPTATPTPPAPEFKKTVVVAPVRGTVKVRLKGSKRFVELDATQGVPFGATLDTKKGAIELTSLSKAGAAPQTATFSRGIFRVTQKGSFTNLTLTERLACAKKPRASASARKKAKKVKTRRLWGSGKGKFRTTGRYSAATVRGTRWLVQDTCTTTVTRVTQGVVAVRDKVKRKTITLRKGKRYTAKKRR